MRNRSGLPVEVVSQFELNSIYDEMLAHYRKLQVHLDIEVTHDKSPAVQSNQPAGTRSIVEKLIDPLTNQQVAVVHYYLLTDGVSIGASGKKDPKRVISNGIDYRPKPQDSDD